MSMNIKSLFWPNYKPWRGPMSYGAGITMHNIAVRLTRCFTVSTGICLTTLAIKTLAGAAISPTAAFYLNCALYSSAAISISLAAIPVALLIILGIKTIIIGVETIINYIKP